MLGSDVRSVDGQQLQGSNFRGTVDMIVDLLQGVRGQGSPEQNKANKQHSCPAGLLAHGQHADHTSLHHTTSWRPQHSVSTSLPSPCTHRSFFSPLYNT